MEVPRNSVNRPRLIRFRLSFAAPPGHQGVHAHRLGAGLQERQQHENHYGPSDPESEREQCRYAHEGCVAQVGRRPETESQRQDRAGDDAPDDGAPFQQGVAPNTMHARMTRTTTAPTQKLDQP